MLLTHETTIVFHKNNANIVGHMCYAAYIMRETTIKTWD